MDNKVYDFDYLFEYYKVLYMYSKNKKAEITTITDKLLLFFNDKDEFKARLSQKIIDKSLEYTNLGFAAIHPDIVANLAYKYWTNPEIIRDRFHNDFYDDLKGYKKYGLNSNVDKHYLSSTVFPEAYFYNTLFTVDFEIGLDFTIRLTNYMVENLMINSRKELELGIIHFDKGNSEYYMNPNLWLAFRGFTVMPNVMILLLKNLEYALLNKIESIESDEKKLEFANYFKERVYKESNNVCLFPMLLSLGIKYFDVLTDYALELFSEIMFVYYDNNRITQEMMGVFEIGKFSNRQWSIIGKHNQQSFRKESIQDYVFKLQMTKDKDKCFVLLDYLYNKNEIKNNTDFYFQVEKTDLRNATFDKVEGGVIVKSGQILSKNSKKIIDKHIEVVQPQNIDGKKVASMNLKVAKNSFVVDDLIILVKEVQSNSNKHQLTGMFDNQICLMFITVLKSDKRLSNKNLDYIINFIYTRLLRFLKHTGVGCMFEDYVSVFDVDINRLNEMNKEMLSNIIYLIYTSNVNGIIKKMMNACNSVLNLEMKKRVVTIIVLKSIEISKYNRERFENQKTRKPTPDIDLNKIIYDFTEGRLKLPNITNIDALYMNVSSLIDIFKVKVNIKVDWMRNLTESVIEYAISTKLNRKDPHNVFYWDLQRYLSGTMLKSIEDGKWIIDVIVDLLDESKISFDVIRFINEIFYDLTPIYFDSFAKKNNRMQIRAIVEYFENSLQEKISPEIKNRFSLSFLLKFHDGIGDISNCQTDYSVSDITYINNKYVNYGKFEPANAIRNLYRLNVEKLFPDLLIGMDSVITKDLDLLRETDIKFVLLKIINFCYYENENFKTIKNDVELSRAFESILEKLIIREIPEAAIILDEFRVY